MGKWEGEEYYTKCGLAFEGKDKYEKAAELFDKVKKYLKKIYIDADDIIWAEPEGDIKYTSMENVIDFINCAIRYDILSCDERGIYSHNDFFDETSGFDAESFEEFFGNILFAALVTAVVNDDDDIDIFIDFFTWDNPEDVEMELEDDYFEII